MMDDNYTVLNTWSLPEQIKSYSIPNYLNL